MKDSIVRNVDARSAQLIDLSKRIYGFNELSFRELKSSRALADFLQEAGFEISWGQAGLETAFVARYGQGAPRIALMGEYDALPDIGHACGHNMIGTISAGAAVALKESGVLEGDRGTIYFVGCPAEEHGGGKRLLAEAGVFDGMDAAMSIHPRNVSSGYDMSYAIKTFYVEFFGKASHAASNPQDGINALDAMIAFFNGIGLMRQRTTERTRTHGIILAGGKSFNTIPDYTKAEMGLRALSTTEMAELEAGMTAVAQGAAEMSGCTYKITENSFYPEMFVNEPIARTLDANYRAIGEETIVFDYDQGIGSTDVGFVTQMLPGTQGYINITDSAPISCHTEAFAQAADSDFGYAAMLRATRALAMTAGDLLTDAALLREAKIFFGAHHQQIQNL